MLGTPSAKRPVSEIITTSAARRSRFASMKGTRFTEPLSSSPSSITLRLTGRRPSVWR
jgi:hypothetical protein